MSFLTQSGIHAAMEVSLLLLVPNRGAPQGFFTRTRYYRSGEWRGIILLFNKSYKQVGLIFLSLVLVGCAKAADSVPLVKPTTATDAVALDATLIVSPEPQRTMAEITPTSLLDGSPPMTPFYGRTYHLADGNRYVSGRGDLPEEKPLDIRLASEPEWVVAAPDELGSIWVIVLMDGRVQAFAVNGSGYEQIAVTPDRLPPGMPPLLKVAGGVPVLVTAPLDDASPLTHPVVVGGDGARIAYIAKNGDVVIWDRKEIGRLPVSALPDARILVDERDRLLLLTDPTRRYDHGVLGDDLEAAGVTLIETQPTLRVASQIQITQPTVIEGIAPIWSDINADGMREIILTRSTPTQGAQIVVFNEIGEEIAAGPSIGRGYRWRNQLALAPFSPNGGLELVDVLTPHLTGVVEFYQLHADRLEITAGVPGYTSHVIGTRNLDMALAGDFDGDGNVEVLLPDQSLTELGAIRRAGDGAAVVWSVPLDGIMTTNLAAVSFPDGSLALGLGRGDGVLRVWLPVRQ
jgi:hypothetical protein